MLLEASNAWPRYTKDQHVEVLTWHVTNQLGQRIQKSMVYAPRNHWQKKVLAFATGFVAVIAGVVGLAPAAAPARPRL